MIRPKAVLAGAAASAVLLAGCGSDAPDVREPAVSPSTSPTASTTPSATPTTTPSPPVTSGPTPSSSPTEAATTTPEAASLQLNGAELGITKLGDPYNKAVAAISKVLGQGAPVTDAVFCIGSDKTTQWGEFRAVSKDGKLSGWTISSDRLEAPSGVKVGTDVATLQRVYGDRLERFEPNPDNGPSFSVTGVDFLGDLSSTGDDATVISLYTASCSGP